ncbi:hypothetical protein P9112_013987 [Eukaryota sp. TZLM1-RC]
MQVLFLVTLLYVGVTFGIDQHYHLSFPDYPNPEILDDYDVYPMSTTDPDLPAQTSYSQVRTEIKSTGESIIVHKLTVPNPINSLFIKPPIGGCGNRSTVVESSTQYGCTSAVNLGFFNMLNGDCRGWLVSNNKFYNRTSLPNSVFGITRSNQYISGYISDATRNEMVASGELLHGLQGRLWLVRQGRSFVSKSRPKEHISQRFVDLIAPRLAVCYDHSGVFHVVQVDGYEPTLYGIGLTQFSDLLVDMGMLNCMNMDGGGSVTVLFNEQIKNSCSDPCPDQDQRNRVCSVPFGSSKCLRKVSSMLCLK